MLPCSILYWLYTVISAYDLPHFRVISHMENTSGCRAFGAANMELKFLAAVCRLGYLRQWHQGVHVYNYGLSMFLFTLLRFPKL